MKTTITLELKTREVHHLFTRKINGDRLFMDAIFHKFNRITGLCRKQDPGAEETYQNIEKSMLNLAQQFSDERGRFREILKKKTGLGDNKITITPSFHPKIIIENPLTVQLVKFLKTYDNLIATLKLLNLAGSFESEQSYYANITHFQKVMNRMLSKIALLRKIPFF